MTQPYLIIATAADGTTTTIAELCRADAVTTQRWIEYQWGESAIIVPCDRIPGNVLMPVADWIRTEHPDAELDVIDDGDEVADWQQSIIP